MANEETPKVDNRPTIVQWLERDKANKENTEESSESSNTPVISAIGRLQKILKK
jgi:hypothetical protein